MGHGGVSWRQLDQCFVNVVKVVIESLGPPAAPISAPDMGREKSNTLLAGAIMGGCKWATRLVQEKPGRSGAMHRSRGRVSRRVEGWECSRLSSAAADFRKDKD